MATYNGGSPWSNYGPQSSITTDTAGGSWWKQFSEWGESVYDTAENWWDSSFQDMNVPTVDKTAFTGLGQREIGLPDGGRFDITKAQGGGSGFDWWETAKKYAGYAEEYVLSPVKGVLDWTKDLYNVAPKWVKNIINGTNPSDAERQRLREWYAAQRAKRRNKGMPQGAVTRNIGLGRRTTPKFVPKGKVAYGGSPLARAIMEQASQNEAIRTTLAGAVSPGSRTISLSQVRTIYPYIYKKNV